MGAWFCHEQGLCGIVICEHHGVQNRLNREEIESPRSNVDGRTGGAGGGTQGKPNGADILLLPGKPRTVNFVMVDCWEMEVSPSEQC
jgi:hypothetical protein